MGRPKALVVGEDGVPWVERATGLLCVGGCVPVVVVLGARAAEARGSVPSDVEVVTAPDWADGMSASLRAGLERLTAITRPEEVHAALVLLVDLPDLVPAVVARLLLRAGPATLARASYDGGPGHPVLLGREHWAGVIAAATGDEGARPYLRAHAAEVRLVACDDLATGADQDTPSG